MPAVNDLDPEVLDEEAWFAGFYLRDSVNYGAPDCDDDTDMDAKLRLLQRKRVIGYGMFSWHLTTGTWLTCIVASPVDRWPNQELFSSNASRGTVNR